jgi:hypothetical protein
MAIVTAGTSRPSCAGLRRSGEALGGLSVPPGPGDQGLAPSAKELVVMGDVMAVLDLQRVRAGCSSVEL